MARGIDLMPPLEINHNQRAIPLGAGAANINTPIQRIQLLKHVQLIALALAGLTACGGGYGGGGTGNGTYTVGGTVTGLTGSGLVLLNNARDPVAVSASGTFTFSAPMASGATYAVSLGTPPTAPAQNCAITDGWGAVRAANVTNVAVVCANVSAVHHYVYVANAGDNTVSVYSIDSGTGTLTAVGTPVATGTSPNAIAVSPDGLHVYVVNEGSNDISGYAVDATSGELAPISGSPFPAGSNPQALALNTTALSETYLYVANKGSNNLSAYSVNVSNGVLAPLTTATYATGIGPSAVVPDYYGSFIFVANNGGSNDISVFAIDAATGALTPVSGSPFAAGGSPHSLVFTLFTDWEADFAAYLYAADVNGSSSTVAGFAVDPDTGVLAELSGSPFRIANSNNIAVDLGGPYLYATAGASVTGYGIDWSSGLLTALSGFPVAAGANAYAVWDDPNDQFLYVGNEGAGSISGYRRSTDGGLAAVPGSPFTAGSRPIAIATH